MKTQNGKWVSGGKDLKESGAYTVRFVRKIIEAVNTSSTSLAHGKGGNLMELFKIIGIEDRNARREHVTQLRLCFKKAGEVVVQSRVAIRKAPSKKQIKYASIMDFMKPIPEEKTMPDDDDDVPTTPPPKRIREVPCI